MIGIIDYGMGNLRSVEKAFEIVGSAARILRGPGEIAGVDRLVLPGVGAFGDGMEQLRHRGWIDPIKSFIAGDRPFLGICLGMQLLFSGSEEDSPSSSALVPGLNVLPGEVVCFRAPPGQRLKVPHMGWNTLSWRREDPLLAGLPQRSAVYFVHSYFARPGASGRLPGGGSRGAGSGGSVGSGNSGGSGGGVEALVSATAEYPEGSPFCASIWRGNLWATQFHPEKSQRVGLKMLANFAAMSAR